MEHRRRTAATVRRPRATGTGFGLALVAALTAAGACATGLAAERPTTGLLGGGVIAAIGVAIVAITAAVVRARARVSTIGRQVAIGAGGGTLVGTVGAWLVVVLGTEALPARVLLASLVVCVAVFVAWSAYVIGMAVGGDIDRISSALMAVGEGRHSVRLDVVGGDQVGHLADAGNRMIEQLRLREAERDEAQATRHELVRAMVDQLRDRAAERDAAEEQRKALFVGVSHDLRTPLTSLQLLVSALRDDVASPEERDRYAEQMLAQITALTRLTEQVFELSRLEAGDMGGRRVRMSLAELLRETVAQTHPDAAAHGVELVADVPDGLPPVEVVLDRIARVVLNLIHNALAHTPAAGRVRVAARAVQDGVEVEVADDGVGIAPGDRPRIFEPFFRGGADASRTRAGAGLGLAISHAIVEAHGGRIWLAEAERGTTIRFALPAAMSGVAQA